MADPTIYFQWQNPYLLDTIYPMRETKLKDFLQYFYEIDIWKEYKSRDQASLASEIQKHRAEQKDKVLKAYQNFEKYVTYFLNEDVTGEFRVMLPPIALDMEIMTRINDIHKLFKKYFPTYQNPAKEKYFTSERMRQVEDMRKRCQTDLNSQKRYLSILPANSPQKAPIEAKIKKTENCIRMLDAELDRYYEFIKAYSRLEVYKQEAIKQKAAREKTRGETEARLRALKTESEALAERLARSQVVGRRLTTPPNMEAARAFCMDEDVTDVYRGASRDIEQNTLVFINNLHKDFKGQFAKLKTVQDEKNVVARYIQALEDQRKKRAGELAQHQRATSWTQPGPNLERIQKTIATLKNNVIKPLEDELDRFYDLQWAYEVKTKPAGSAGSLVEQNKKERTDLENQLREKKDSLTVEEAAVARLGQELGLGEKEQMLALVDALPVTMKDIVRGKIDKYRDELEARTNAQLLEDIVSRFMKEPERYPLWLQYMTVHFSGMRYQSAHGSWADPRQLLLSLRMKAHQDSVKGKGAETVATRMEERYAMYKAALSGQAERGDAPVPPPALALATEPRWKEKVANHLRELDPARQYSRKTALLNLLSDEDEYEISRMNDQEVLDQLGGMREKIPDWMWNEVKKLTQLRLIEVKDKKWEQVSDEDMAKRYTQEMAPYREILENWKRSNLTGWREEHDRANQLIVTRAVCNEVAEHIQHLRGHTPAGGLTAKPGWYRAREDDKRWAAAGDPAYLVKARKAADFKSGASILWLQWVNKQPSPWQIAMPRQLKSGEDLIEEFSDASTRIVNQGSCYVRDARFTVKDASGQPTERTEHQWLRWLHEATVVLEAETVDGPTILTFETALPYEPRSQSTIGVFKHHASNLLYNVSASVMNGTFIGYVPEGDAPYGDLRDMLDWNRVLLRNAYPPQQIQQYWDKVTRPSIAPVSFDTGLFPEIYPVEVSPRLAVGEPLASIRCYTLNPATNCLELSQPEVNLRRGTRMQVDKRGVEYLDHHDFYPVYKCDEEPLANELYVRADQVVDAPEEGSSAPFRARRETELLQISGVDEQGRPVFEASGVSLPKGVRLRVSTVHAAGKNDAGNGIARARGRQAAYLVQTCAFLGSAEGLFIRTRDIRKISERWYRKTCLSLR